MRLTTIAILTLCLAAACASAPRPAPAGEMQIAPLIATGSSGKAFTGLWRGTLQLAAGGERPVEFRLEPGQIFFHSADEQGGKILWVRIAGEKLSGAIEPRFDPARNADVYTTFEAEIVDGAMRGLVRERVGLEWRDAATFTATRVQE